MILNAITGPVGGGCDLLNVHTIKKETTTGCRKGQKREPLREMRQSVMGVMAAGISGLVSERENTGR